MMKESKTKKHAGAENDSNILSNRAKELLLVRQCLPAYSASHKLIEMLKSHRTVVLCGETGSGKTTQLPQMILRSGFLGSDGTIACTQPRRVAAITVARRVAEEMGTPLGQKVGYAIRFEDMTSSQTRIKYMTEGLLLREALQDKTLSKYKLVIVDEAHERTVHTDVLLGLLKQVLKLRSQDFRLLVMSATLDVDKFVNYFEDHHDLLSIVANKEAKQSITGPISNTNGDADVHKGNGKEDVVSVNSEQTSEVESSGKRVPERPAKKRRKLTGNSILDSLREYDNSDDDHDLEREEDKNDSSASTLKRAEPVLKERNDKGKEFVDPGSSMNSVNVGVKKSSGTEVKTAKSDPSTLESVGAAYIQGRQFPVQVLYTADVQSNYLEAAVNATLQIHAEEPAGDILVFLTGQDEIEAAQRLIEMNLPQKPHNAVLESVDPNSSSTLSPVHPSNLLVIPIYASLTPEMQLRAFQPAPPGFRKAVLATNIAETSITLQGVRYVIDTGMVKSRQHRAGLGLDTLAVVPVSQAQARQRSGRAGREAAGKAYRLFPESEFVRLSHVTPPEILRTNLSAVILQLKALGVDDVIGFDFLDPPPRAAVARALELLLVLGALDPRGQLSRPTGERMARLPVDPMYGKVLLAADEMGCVREAVRVVAMVSTDSVFVTPRAKEDLWRAAHLKFVSRLGDHVTLLNVFQSFIAVAAKHRLAWCADNFLSFRALTKAGEIVDQLERLLAPPPPQGLGLPNAHSSCGEDTRVLCRALTAGLFPHATLRQADGSLKVLATGREVFVHPKSVLAGKPKAPPCLVFDELVMTTKPYARSVCAIDPAWLPELAPAFFVAKAAAAAMGASGGGGGGGGGGGNGFFNGQVAAAVTRMGQ